MAISNINEYKNSNNFIISSHAEKNYSTYKEASNKLFALADNKCMLTNIEEMKNKLNSLKADGTLDNKIITSTQLTDCLEQAIKIQLKPSKGLMDISDFYNTYINFRDICNHLGGGSFV